MHEETIAFCISSGILFEFEKQLQFTSFGKKLIKANPENNWELNESQKNAIIDACKTLGFDPTNYDQFKHTSVETFLNS